MDQQLALLILGDLDPYPPTITRRASPPPHVRRAANEVLKRAASFFGAELDRHYRKWSRSSTRTRTTSATASQYALGM